MNFFPKNPEFFEWFEEMAHNVKACGDLLAKLTLGSSQVAEEAKKARELELQADELRQRLTQAADKTFITPIDREDIHALARKLDDIADRIENVISAVSLYGIQEPVKAYADTVAIIQRAVTSLDSLVGHLKNASKKAAEIQRLMIEIDFLENEGDALTRRSLGELFSDGHDPITVVKWKDIFEEMEEVLDRCKGAADVVNQIIIKNF